MTKTDGSTTMPNTKNELLILCLDAIQISRKFYKDEITVDEMEKEIEKLIDQSLDKPKVQDYPGIDMQKIISGE